LPDGAGWFPQGVSDPAVLRILLACITIRVRDYHPLWFNFPEKFHFCYAYTLQSYNPTVAETTMVWAVPRSLATTWGITIVFFSSGYLDVSVLRVGYFRRYAFSVPGCPIRKSANQGLFPPHRGLSQVITSFIASESQGILHAPLLTFFVFYFCCISFPICQRTFSL
jgi:hypothetical protein